MACGGHEFPDYHAVPRELGLHLFAFCAGVLERAVTIVAGVRALREASPLRPLPALCTLKAGFWLSPITVYPQNNPTEGSVEQEAGRERDSEPLVPQETAPASSVTQAAVDGLGSARAAPVEDPPWSVPEVVALALAAFFLVLLSLASVSILANRFLFHQPSWLGAAQRPAVVLVAQTIGYVLVLVLMYWVAGARGEQPRKSIQWNWPQHWALYLWYGIGLSIGLQMFAHFLPMPKTLPIDQFFETPRQAWLLSIFGITLAPLMEELFFRGFLYPALARWLNVPFAILITGLAFGGIHGDQLRYSWGPVLVIVLVGMVLTTVRAYTRSVASTVLMHVGYNLTIMVALFYGTDGFRHLEKLKQ